MKSPANKSDNLRKQIIKDANNYIVVDDGQFRYPVRRSSLRPGDSETLVKSMSGDEYGAWCQVVPSDLRIGEAGTLECLQLCEDLVEAGADVWHVE